MNELQQSTKPFKMSIDSRMRFGSNRRVGRFVKQSTSLKNLLDSSHPKMSRLEDGILTQKRFNERKSYLNQDSYNCQHCNFTTSVEGRLRRHMIDIHASFKTYQCDVCKYVASSKSNLDIHISEIHNKSTSSSITTSDSQNTRLNTNSSHLNSASSNLLNDRQLKHQPLKTNVGTNTAQRLGNKLLTRKGKRGTKSHKKLNRKGFWNSNILNEYWTLKRIGYKQKLLVLDPKVPNMTIGRSRQCHLVCKAEYISRKHLELRLITLPNEDVIWSIIDLESSMGTYINGSQIPKNEAVTLSDGDLLSLGASLNETDTLDQKYLFLYKINSPFGL